jgi:hypothetical protein
MHGLNGTHHRPENHFRLTRCYSYVMWVKWNLISVHLEKVLILIQDRCMICVERTIGSKIILDAPKLLQDVDQVKVHFGPFGDCVNVDTR